ncbi:MAG: hypothetical protein JNN15_18695 [Blastocatellia bacterium]|nr:hypothetical protein [Blastocatellia bacterium]
MSIKDQDKKVEGKQKWIRLRGSPSDPESFELALWNGLAWEIETKTDDGRKITLKIPDYMVLETFPVETDPQNLYKAKDSLDFTEHNENSKKEK